MASAYEYTYKGQTHTVKEWADILHISPKTMQNRISWYYDINPEKCFEMSHRYYEINGVIRTPQEWADLFGISVPYMGELYRKYKQTGRWTFEQQRHRKRV